jgi:hypothetical protein
MTKRYTQISCFLRIPYVKTFTESDSYTCSKDSTHNINKKHSFCSICGSTIVCNKIKKESITSPEDLYFLACLKVVDTYSFEEIEELELDFIDEYILEYYNEIKESGLDFVKESNYSDGINHWFTNNEKNQEYYLDLFADDSKLLPDEFKNQYYEGLFTITPEVIEKCIKLIPEDKLKLIKLLSWYLNIELKPEFGIKFYCN